MSLVRKVDEATETSSRPIKETLLLFEDFIDRERIAGWQALPGRSKTPQSFVVAVTNKFEPIIQMKPRSLWGILQNVVEHLERHGRRFKRIRRRQGEVATNEMRIPYAYLVEFEFVSHLPNLTTVAFKTIETLDPQGRLAVDLQKYAQDFSLPEIPEGKGHLGRRFLDHWR
jgi:hypothetical protein